MFSPQYLKDLGERVLASFATGVLTVVGTDALSLFDLDWKAALGLGASFAVTTILKGLVARKVGDPESASLLK